MQFDGAVINEQGITFVVAAVKKQIMDNQQELSTALDGFHGVFAGMPVILMAQNYQGRPIYYGRRDIASFLSRIAVSRIPWRRYSIN